MANTAQKHEIFRTLSQLLSLGVFLCALIVLFFSSPAFSQPPTVSKAPTKTEVISRLKAIQERQNSELQSIDEAIKKRLAESTSLTLKSQDPKIADRRILRLSGQIDDLSNRRAEYAARREFLNDLIFTVDTKWSSQPLNQFLEHTFLDMAATDLTDAKSDQNRWRFLMYLSITVREVPEPREDVINIVENYINFSSILEPKTPALFLSSRSYTNGSLSYSAKPISRDHVGDFVEAQLATQSKNQNKKTDGKTPADIELRIAPITPPPDEAPVDAPAARDSKSAATQPDNTTEKPAKIPPQVIEPTDGASLPRPVPNPPQTVNGTNR